MRSLRLLAVLSISLAGCGASDGTRTNPDGGGGGDAGGPLAGLVSIDVQPASASLTVMNGVAATQAFTATGRFMDGHTADVTALVSWSIADVGLGQIASGQFTSTTARGGKSMVTASDGIHPATAQLSVKWVTTRVATDDGATTPSDAAQKFGAATTNDPSLAPKPVYPLDGAFVPHNLGELEVQWTRTAADLYEVRLQAPQFDLTLYTNATVPAQGGRLMLLAAEWNALAGSVANDTVNITVRGLATASNTVGASSNVRLAVGSDGVMGGIYYWSASGAAGTVEGIKRHEFGDVTSPAKDFYTINDGNAVFNDGGNNHCVACHVLSRDGTKAAITFNGGDGVAALLDVATKNPMIPVSKGEAWNFATFSPDGNKLIASHGGAFTIYDTSAGAGAGTVLGTVPTGGLATHPDWSPDGTKLVYVREGAPSNGNPDWSFKQGSIVVLTMNGGTFGTPQEIVTSKGENNYYPSFSPDGKWILFDRSTGDAYDDDDATLYVISADGKVGPIRLDAANGVGKLTNSWPRWSPFVQHNAQGGDLLYFTFSSKRDYGIEMGSLSGNTNPTRPQVWMGAFDPSIAVKNMDPSSTPFWLPFQDVMTNNHIAQWTQAIVGIN